MRLSPKRIPDLSFRVENINGNVIGVEELSIFLFDMFFRIFGLYAKGRLVLKESNCLKYVFLEYNPDSVQRFSNRSKEVFNFSGLVSAIVKYV